PPGRAPVRGGSSLLRVRLHLVAEAILPAEHRDRRRGWSCPRARRVGRRHGTGGMAGGRAVRDRVPVDPAPFLGAVAPVSARLPRRRGPHAPRGRRFAGHDSKHRAVLDRPGGRHPGALAGGPYGAHLPGPGCSAGGALHPSRAWTAVGRNHPRGDEPVPVFDPVSCPAVRSRRARHADQVRALMSRTGAVVCVFLVASVACATRAPASLAPTDRLVSPTTGKSPGPTGGSLAEKHERVVGDWAAPFGGEGLA